MPVFGVSGKNALSAKIVAGGIDPALGPGAKQWHESGLERVETYLRNQLGQFLLSHSIYCQLMFL